MSNSNHDEYWSYFFEIYEAMPRQGPGMRESTERALDRLPPLTTHQHLLDIGCGTGAQTFDLARGTQARIVAVDNHPAFLSQLESRASRLGLGDRITARVGDMANLPFDDGSFDVLWSEGAIFIVGFAEGLSAWRRLLVPGGHLVVSELCWLRDAPLPELEELFLKDGAEVGTVDARRKAIAENGYRLLEDFVLPKAGWWDHYLVPLGESVERFRRAHARNPAALAVADRCQREIDVYQRHGDSYGYVFFIMQRE